MSRPGRGQRVIAPMSGPRPRRRGRLLIDPAARADQPHAPRPRAAGHPEGWPQPGAPAPELPMGPAATTTTHPPVPRRPIIGSRPGASRTPASRAPQARLARSLTPPGPITRDGQLSGNRARPGPRESPRASPACPPQAENRDKRLHTGRLTRPRSFRDDIGRALITMLRTVAGLRDRAPRPWTGSWTEPSVQPVRSGPSVAPLRGIRAASAYDARAVVLIIRRS